MCITRERTFLVCNNIRIIARRLSEASEEKSDFKQNVYHRLRGDDTVQYGRFGEIYCLHIQTKNGRINFRNAVVFKQKKDDG
jgi:hypothetical protein